MKVNKSFFILLAISCLLSCSRQDGIIADTSNPTSGILVPASRLPLFANIEGYKVGSTSTKSSPESEATYPLDSLLDRRSSESVTMDGYVISQTPFCSNLDGSYARVILSDRMVSGFVRDSLTPIRMFLIEYENTKDGSSGIFVATMMTHVDYLDIRYESQISFLNKGNFSGVIIYSDILGTFKDVSIYLDGLVVEGELLTHAPTDTSGNVCIGLLKQVGTKSDDIEWIVECVIVAKQKKTDEQENEDSDIHDDRAVHDELGGGGGGSGNTGGDTGNNPTYKISDEDDLPIYHTVELSSSLGGTAYPSGKYTDGTSLGIHAAPASGYFFDRWVGSLAGEGQTIFLCVKKDIVATAYFKSNTVSNPRPCVDRKTDKANPLKDMTLAKSGGWNIAGATFGYTRNDHSTFHNGIDLYGEVGTAIYSMSDGIFLSYWHLQAGNPVAINPRTGIPFAKGDVVYQGEVIGYIGRTGNAWDVPYSHLHLNAKDRNGSMNPSSLINGAISTSSVTITNIICDE